MITKLVCDHLVVGNVLAEQLDARAGDYVLCHVCDLSRLVTAANQIPSIEMIL